MRIKLLAALAAAVVALTACNTTLTLRPNGEQATGPMEVASISLDTKSLDIKKLTIKDEVGNGASGEEAAKTFIKDITPNLVEKGIPLVNEGEATISFKLTYVYKYVKTMILPIPVPIARPKQDFIVAAKVEKSGRVLFVKINGETGGPITPGSFLGSRVAANLAAEIAKSLRVTGKTPEPGKTVLVNN